MNLQDNKNNKNKRNKWVNYVAEKGITEFLGQSFLFVFNSSYRPMMHHLATIHKCDQPTNTVCRNKCLSL